MSDERRDDEELATGGGETGETGEQRVPAAAPDPDGSEAREGPDAADEPAEAEAAAGSEDSAGERAGAPDPGMPEPEPASRKLSVAGALIGALLALLGFTLVVQVRSNAGDDAAESLRQSDLVQIMADLDAAERRLSQDIAALEQTKRELQSGVAGRDAALAEAKERADTLAILAGTMKARGPGLMLNFFEQTGKIKAATLLNAVQELRGAGAEALQIDGAGGSVRIIASTSITDGSGGVQVDHTLLRAPYTIRAIGDPTTMRIAMAIPGGVQDAVSDDGGTVIVNQLSAVEINEIRSAPDLEYARPVR